jgi:hypothetical protein
LWKRLRRSSRFIIRALGEAIGAIETERALAMADQAATHQRENELAQQYLEDRRPAFYQEAGLTNERDTGRGGNRNRDRGREDGRRERSHSRMLILAPTPM